MAFFYFEIDASATYGLTAPTLEVLVDGVVVSSASITEHTGSGINYLRFTLEYSGSAPSSLEFRFNDGGEGGRNIAVNEVRINGWAVDTTYISMMTLLNGDTSSVTVASVDHLLGRTSPVLADLPAETITGTAGDDDIRGTNDPEIINAGDGNDRVRGLDSGNAIFGGIGSDTLFGGAGNDIVVGDDGADALYGEAGNDIIHGSAGNDTVNGGDGHDLINGGADNDTLFGDLGNDIIYGESGNDIISGGGGNDLLFGDDGLDTISAGAGDDVVYGGLDGDTIYGEAGSDTLYGEAGDDTLYGGAGNDTIYGNNGNDVIRGGLGNDTIQGNDGDDTINGDAGADTIEGGAGNDILVGGADLDTLTYANAAAGVTVSLAILVAQNTVGAGTDTVSGFENMTGSAYNDTLTGDTADNTINGGNGNDTIEGGAGNDSLIGGVGTDTLTYANAASAITLSLALTTGQNTGGAGTDTVSGFENLTGSAYNDTLYGDSAANTLSGGGGDDTLRGGAGNDTIDGGAGIDTLDYSAAAAAVTVNLTTGSASNDGDGGSDTLSNFENVIGTSGADTITGGSATGTLSGGAGGDTITSGSTDTLTAQVNAILAANSGVVYHSTTGSFYKFVNSNVTWSAANTGASGTTINGIAGHLAHSTSSTENSYMDSIAGTTDIWVGMSDSATEGAWLFIGGILNGLQFWQGTSSGSAQNSFYTNWATNQPNNSGGGGGSDYMSIEDGGQWDDFAGTGRSKQSYVIEWEGSQLLIPTTSTTLSGGDGLDSLYGAAGQDIFLFEAATAYNNIDRIYNYNFSHLDKIDIGDLLSGYTAGSSDDDLFAQFVVSGSDLLLQVDSNGSTGGSSYTSVAQLMGAATSGLNIEEMVANGLLVMT